MFYTLLIILGIISAVLLVRMNKKNSSQSQYKKRISKSGYSDDDLDIKDLMSPTKKRKSQDKGFSAISIIHDQNACPSVKKLKNIRFLTSKVPFLPLKICTNAASCQCRYEHHADRRAVDRRDIFNSNFSHVTDALFETNKRQSNGRRATDH